MSVHMCICRSVGGSVRPSVCPLICLFVGQSVSVIHIYILYLCMYQSVQSTIVHTQDCTLYMYINVHLCVCTLLHTKECTLNVYVQCTALVVYRCILYFCMYKSVHNTIVHTQDCTMYMYINVHLCVCTILHTKECTLNVYVQCTALLCTNVFCTCVCTKVYRVQLYTLRTVHCTCILMYICVYAHYYIQKNVH